MINNLIYKTRVNVFENARFYYYLLWVLISYIIIREVVQKTALVYYDMIFIMPREIIGVLFFVFSFCTIVSTWLLRNQIDKKYFVFVGALVIISFVNEIRFSLTSTNYDIISSITYGQLYYAAKIIFPFLFLGFWPLLDEHKARTTNFIHLLEKLFLINAGVLLFGGVLLGLPVLESYPLTGRWGYCGLLLDRVVTQFSYGLLLLYTWRPEKPLAWKSLVFIICLLVSGQKAGFLWVGLFLLVVVIKHRLFRATAVGLCLSFVAFFPLIIRRLVSLSPFWRDVYENSGAWAVLFSTRNNAVLKFWEKAKIDTNYLDILLGGTARFPSDIEMLPFDIFIFFGVVGLISSMWFLVKWVNSWRWGVPLMVACFSGGVFGSPSMTLFYGLFLLSSLVFENKAKP